MLLGLRAGLVLLALTIACSAGGVTLPGSSQADALRLVSGDDQQAEPGALLPEPLVVQVLNGDQQPLVGVTVEFGFVGDLAGASLNPATALTDSAGQASAEARLGDAAGAQVIVAQVANTSLSDLRTEFTATAVPGETGGPGRDKGGNDGHGHDGGDEDEH